MMDVLVAEDEPDLLHVIELKLRLAGYHVRTASDGATALAEALARPPDVALLDVVMPGLSGLQVCRSMRAGAPTASVPILLVTARCGSREVADGYAAGADDLLVKPFSPREMVGRIEALLLRSQNSASRARHAARATLASLAGLRRVRSHEIL